MNIQFGCVFYELLLGKHGEYLMSEVSKFLIEEYDNTNHKINEINYSIRGLDIDIDSIDNYLNQKIMIHVFVRMRFKNLRVKDKSFFQKKVCCKMNFRN